MLERAARVRAARPDAVLGVHLEGPFLGGAPGAHPPEVLRRADLDFLRDLCDTFGDLVRLVTLAPEADPGPGCDARCSSSAASSSRSGTPPSTSTARAPRPTRARRIVTHLFNGMGPLHHRAPGLAGRRARRPAARAVAHRRLRARAPRAGAARPATRAPDAVLVTDAVATEPPVIERDGAAYLADGTLAGSTLTMDAVLRNVASIGVPLAAAVRHATGEPGARARAERSRPGRARRAADLVALDPDTLAVRAVWTAGVPVPAA